MRVDCNQPLIGIAPSFDPSWLHRTAAQSGSAPFLRILHRDSQANHARHETDRHSSNGNARSPAPGNHGQTRRAHQAIPRRRVRFGRSLLHEGAYREPGCRVSVHGGPRERRDRSGRGVGGDPIPRRRSRRYRPSHALRRMRPMPARPRPHLPRYAFFGVPWPSRRQPIRIHRDARGFVFPTALRRFHGRRRIERIGRHRRIRLPIGRRPEGQTRRDSRRRPHWSQRPLVGVRGGRRPGIHNRQNQRTAARRRTLWRGLVRKPRQRGHSGHNIRARIPPARLPIRVLRPTGSYRPSHGPIETWRQAAPHRHPRNGAHFFRDGRHAAQGNLHTERAAAERVRKQDNSNA